MTERIEKLRAPFPYFGGKSRAAGLAWGLIGADVPNYVEPFFGGGAVLLSRPGGAGKTETVNDTCGYIANFWRAIQSEPELVAQWANWPVNEIDLTARHGWLVNRKERLLWALEDPDYYDAKIAGWWAWGVCAWIGDGWCAGVGPWQSNGAEIRKPEGGAAGRGINRSLPYMSTGGRGINRQLPHLGRAGKGINRRTGGMSRSEFIESWFRRLAERLRDVRVACGDWSRVCGYTPTTHQGLTGVFLDPPYSAGDMQYAAGGVGGELADEVRAWCAESGANPKLRIVLCGHDGEHDALLPIGWTKHHWNARKGYAAAAEARARAKSETVWASPGCVAQ